jgi:hypothetical protein
VLSGSCHAADRTLFEKPKGISQPLIFTKPSEDNIK